MRLQNAWSGVLTGKGCAFGGSAGRTEATGYGCIHFCQHALEHVGDSIADKRVAISGAGTVALHAAEKAIAEGARVVTLSDSGGMAYFPGGLSPELLQRVIEHKQTRGTSLEQLMTAAGAAEFHAGDKPWGVDCDVAMPCAIENELDADAAQRLVDNGVRIVCEGANMPCTPGAIERFRAGDVTFAPGKAANAGGVAVSGMELSQNAMRLSWSRERVDRKLKDTMSEIHGLCVRHGKPTVGSGRIDYVRGANIGGFLKVAEAMLAYGVT
jgi:glutamate dehydrogenase (NADP+)